MYPSLRTLFAFFILVGIGFAVFLPSIKNRSDVLGAYTKTPGTFQDKFTAMVTSVTSEAANEVREQTENLILEQAIGVVLKEYDKMLPQKQEVLRAAVCEVE